MISLLESTLAEAQTITTFAGAEPNGNPATNVSIGAAQDIKFDSQGNLYLSSACRILKIDTTSTVSVFAGGPVCGYAGDSGQAVNAKLAGPKGLAFDSAGNLFFADTSNHVVRKITPAGIISTLAGNGSRGFSGDGGPAVSAQLNNPYGVVVDGSGNLYITDNGNFRIRKVDTSGSISTFAGTGVQGFSGDGGQAALAQLWSPAGICLDSSGSLIFADQFIGRIRKIATNGVISRIAGGGGGSGENIPATSAGLYYPINVSVDSIGNLYITDQNSHRIRKVDTSGLIVTIAGSSFGSSGYGGDGGPATSALLSSPTAAIPDASGSIIIADFSNLRIRRVSTSGTISTFAGNGSLGFNGDGIPATTAMLGEPESLAFDTIGNLYVADYLGHRIRKITPQGAISTFAGTGFSGFSGDNGPATNAQLSSPYSICFDVTGNLLISDAGNNRIRRVTQGGTISTIVGTGVAGFSGDGGLAINASINFAYAIACDTGGNLFIADYSNRRVRMVNSSGVIQTIAGTGAYGSAGDDGPALSATLTGPTGLALDETGNLYIADNRIRKIDTTGIISALAGTGSFGYGGDGGPAANAQFGSINGFVRDAAGTFYISDSTNYRIRKIDPSGIVSTIAGTGVNGYSGDGGPATSAQIGYARGLALDGLGNLFISDGSNRRIRKVSLGIPITLATSPAGLQLTADGSTAATPSIQQWSPGSVHTLTAPSPQGSGNTRYVFSSWSNSGTQTQSYTVPNTTSDSLTASFTTQHNVAVNVVGSGSVTPSGFLNSGSQTLTATPTNACSAFSGFTGDATGTSPLNLLVDGPKSLTATFSSTTAPNLTASFTILRGGFSFNRGLNRTVQTVTITNNGSTVAYARFALDSLSTNATLTNGAGNTVCATPLAPTFAIGPIAAGQTLSFTLQFNQTAAGTITYTPRVLGNGSY